MFEQNKYDEANKELSGYMNWIKIDENSISFLGAGYPFYFIVIKFCIRILLTLFFIEGITNIILFYFFGRIKEVNPWIGMSMI